MDSIPDLPPVTDQHQPHFTGPTTNGAHPPYPDMIEAAIVALKDRDGSSRQAIAKFIERHYANLPPTHSTLLTYHLKRMKNEGQLTMVKHSYMLPAPRSVPFESPGLAPTMNHDISDYSITSTDTFGSSPGFKAENSSVQPRRKPGRPPKPRHEFGFQVQNQLPDEQPATAIPPYQPQFEQHLGSGQDFHPQNPFGAPTHDQSTYASGQEFQGNYAGGAEPIFASLGLADDGGTVAPAPPLQSPENVVVSAKRGRGRPPKVNRPVVASSGDGVPDGGADGGSVGGADGGGGEVEVERRVKRKVGRPKLMSMMMFNGGGKKRGVGRPKRIGRPVTVPLSGNVIGRGRPKKVVTDQPAQNLSVNGGDGTGTGEGGGGSVSRGRGRPRKSFGSANKVEKSFGWPNQFGQGTAVIVTDPHQLVAFQELKSKYEHLQSKAREVLNVARPYINADYAAIGVLQELETLLKTDTDSNAAA